MLESKIAAGESNKFDKNDIKDVMNERLLRDNNFFLFSCTRRVLWFFYIFRSILVLPSFFRVSFAMLFQCYFLIFFVGA